MEKVKLFITDIDGTLTDGNCYYSEKGEKLKKFSHRDGRGIYLLHQAGVKVAMITSETGGINAARAKKLIKLGTVSDFFDGEISGGKLDKAKVLCEKYKIKLSEVAFIGDDTNDLEILDSVGHPAIVFDANYKLQKKGYWRSAFEGGHNAVRDFIDYLFETEKI